LFIAFEVMHHPLVRIVRNGGDQALTMSEALHTVRSNPNVVVAFDWRTVLPPLARLTLAALPKTIRLSKEEELRILRQQLWNVTNVWLVDTTELDLIESILVNELVEDVAEFVERVGQAKANDPALTDFVGPKTAPQLRFAIDVVNIKAEQIRDLVREAQAVARWDHDPALARRLAQLAAGLCQIQRSRARTSDDELTFDGLGDDVVALIVALDSSESYVSNAGPRNSSAPRLLQVFEGIVLTIGPEDEEEEIVDVASDDGRVAVSVTVATGRAAGNWHIPWRHGLTVLVTDRELGDEPSLEGTPVCLTDVSTGRTVVRPLSSVESSDPDIRQYMVSFRNLRSGQYRLGPPGGEYRSPTDSSPQAAVRVANWFERTIRSWTASVWRSRRRADERQLRMAA